LICRRIGFDSAFHVSPRLDGNPPHFGEFIAPHDPESFAVKRD
jgi:hypothetical protein